MEEEKNGVSIGDIFRVIFSQKWLALIIAVAITVVGTLVLKFGYSRIKTDYVSTFSINFPGSEETTPVFPDNKPFSYRSIVSLENLASVKASAEEFEKIDIEKMYSKGDISISRSVSELTTEMSDTEFTIRIKAKYFADRATAARFIDKLANIPVDYVKGLALDQDAYLKGYSAETDYEAKVGLLQSQLDYINSNFIVLKGSIKDNDYNAFSVKIEAVTDKLNSVTGTLRENLYVADNNTVADYKFQLLSMTARRDQKLDELKLLFGNFEGSTGDIISSGQASEDVYVRQLAKDISALNTKIAVYELYTGSKTPVIAPKEFTTSLDGIYNELDSLTQSYEKMLGEYYSSVSLVAYGGATVVEEGGFGLIMSALISLVIGLIIAAIIAYAVGWKKFKKPTATDDKAVEAVAEDTAKK